MGRGAAQEASSAVAPEGVDAQRDVVYGEADGQALLLDLYRPPARDEPRPAVILLHGGSWTLGLGSRSEMQETAEALAAAGYVAVPIVYRLMDGKPGHNVWPAQLDDAQRAVRWVRANAKRYGGDPGRIGAYGVSAGGHLAAMLGVRDTRDNADATLASVSSRVNCVIDFAGSTDHTLPDPDPTWDDLLANFLGGTPEEAPEAYRDASPLTWVDEATAPFLILHGLRDTIQPLAHSRLLLVALQDAQVEVVYAELAGADHWGWRRWTAVGPLILAFLAIQLHPER